MGIVKRNEMQKGRNKNKGMELVEDYDLCDNHGLGGDKQVRNSDTKYQLGGLQRKLKIVGTNMGK